MENTPNNSIIPPSPEDLQNELEVFDAMIQSTMERAHAEGIHTISMLAVFIKRGETSKGFVKKTLPEIADVIIEMGTRIAGVK